MAKGRWLAVIAFCVAASALAAGAFVVVFAPSGDSAPEVRRRTDLESSLDMPAQMPEMAATYHHVESHQSTFQRVPCYCGCGKAIGHQNLFDCFVISPGVYSDHAFGCTLCLDEAADVQRLSEAGQDDRTIRSWIDVEYSKYGPPTNTP
jgi:Protein of unknown function with PCYCGC motif